MLGHGGAKDSNGSHIGTIAYQAGALDVALDADGNRLWSQRALGPTHATARRAGSSRRRLPASPTDAARLRWARSIRLKPGRTKGETIHAAIRRLGRVIDEPGGSLQRLRAPH